MTPTNPQDGVELKPCPFCGGEARLMNSKRTGFIDCRANDCGAEIRRSSPAKAIAAWNTRTPAQPIADAGLTSGEAIARTLHKRFCERARQSVTHNSTDSRCYSNNEWVTLPYSVQRQYLEDADAILATLRTAPSERVGEVEALRAYHDAVEEMVCVWRGTNQPSSMDEDAWDDPEEGDNRWCRFATARAALAARQAPDTGEG